MRIIALLPFVEELNSYQSGIYQIRNLLNERKYIGSTSSFKKRHSEHLSRLRNNSHCNQFLQRDFNKCGEEFFVFEIVELMNLPDDRLSRETFWIGEYYDNQQNCYNICVKANSTLGRKHSEETKRKLSESKKGLPSSMKGRKHSDATKKKMREAQLGEKNHAFGKKVPDEMKNKRVEGLKRSWSEGRHKGMLGKVPWNKGTTGNKLSTETVEKMKKEYVLIVISPEGKKFYNIKGCKGFAKLHCLNEGNFNQMLLGKRKSCQGWTCEKY